MRKGKGFGPSPLTHYSYALRLPFPHRLERVPGVEALAAELGVAGAVLGLEGEEGADVVAAGVADRELTFGNHQVERVAILAERRPDHGALAARLVDRHQDLERGARVPGRAAVVRSPFDPGHELARLL